MKERKLIREFLDAVNVCHQCGQNPCRCIEVCGYCHCDPCECPGHQKSEDYSLDSLEHGEAHHEMELSHDGTISPEELHHHFDLNDDGKVTPQEYVDHVQYHANNPDTLSHYNSLKQDSCMSVPCANTYDSCAVRMIDNPSDLEACLKPLMDMTGSSCHHSAAQGLLDAVKTLINCGIL